MSEQLNDVVPASQDCVQLELQSGPCGMVVVVVSSRPAHPQHLFSSTLMSQLLAFTVLPLSCSSYPQG